jgi:hypothetical protein
MNDLPHEILIQILEHLSNQDLLSIGLVNKRLLKTSCHDLLWKKFFEKMYFNSKIDFGYKRNYLINSKRFKKIDNSIKFIKIVKKI